MATASSEWSPENRLPVAVSPSAKGKRAPAPAPITDFALRHQWASCARQHLSRLLLREIMAAGVTFEGVENFLPVFFRFLRHPITLVEPARKDANFGRHLFFVWCIFLFSFVPAPYGLNYTTDIWHSHGSPELWRPALLQSCFVPLSASEDLGRSVPCH